MDYHRAYPSGYPIKGKNVKKAVAEFTRDLKGFLDDTSKQIGRFNDWHEDILKEAGAWRTIEGLLYSYGAVPTASSSKSRGMDWEELLKKDGFSRQHEVLTAKTSVKPLVEVIDAKKLFPELEPGELTERFIKQILADPDLLDHVAVEAGAKTQRIKLLPMPNTPVEELEEIRKKLKQEYLKQYHPDVATTGTLEEKNAITRIINTMLADAQKFISTKKDVKPGEETTQAAQEPPYDEAEDRNLTEKYAGKREPKE